MLPHLQKAVFSFWLGPLVFSGIMAKMLGDTLKEPKEPHIFAVWVLTVAVGMLMAIGLRALSRRPISAWFAVLACVLIWSAMMTIQGAVYDHSEGSLIMARISMMVIAFRVMAIKEEGVATVPKTTPKTVRLTKD